MRVTAPTTMGLLDWANLISIDLGSLGTVPRLDKAEEWPEWAANLFVILGISGPNPYLFKDWRDWAERFIQVVA